MTMRKGQKKMPIVSNQGRRCKAARGNLTLAQAAAVSGYAISSWWSWENERVGIPPYILSNFRAAARKKFSHYRSDLL